MLYIQGGEQEIMDFFLFLLDPAEQLVAHQSVFRGTQPESLLEQVCSGKSDARLKQKGASSQTPYVLTGFVCVQLS